MFLKSITNDVIPCFCNSSYLSFIYQKYYPVQNGYIEIELIDNPFSDHPTDLAFNGWVTNYQGANISYDSDYYTRYVKVPVTYTNGIPNVIHIDMHASWTNATVSYVNGSNSFDDAQAQLKDMNMHEIETVKYIYDNTNVAGYYKGSTITTTATKSGWGSPEITYGTCTDCYDEDANYYSVNSQYTCPAPSFGWFESGTKTNDCATYYLQDENDEYDPNATYYQLKNGRFVETKIEAEIIGVEESDLFKADSNISGYYRHVSLNYNDTSTGYYYNL